MGASFNNLQLIQNHFVDKNFIGAKFIASQEGVDIETHILPDRGVVKNFINIGKFDLVIVPREEVKGIAGVLLGDQIDHLLNSTRAAVLVVK